MERKKSIHTIILDAGPIFKNDPSVDTLIAKSETLITVPSVLTEIRDQPARLRAETLLQPFLTLRSPRPQSLQFVIGYSKKSGDYSVLSRTDLEILALTYELDCERNGGDQHLRKFPAHKFYNSPQKTKSDKELDEIPRESVDLDSKYTLEEPQSNHVTETDQKRESVDLRELSHGLQNVRVEGSTPDEENNSAIPTGPLPEPPVDQPSEPKPNTSDSDDSDGWITPSNLRKHQARDLKGSTAPISAEANMQVACLTNDFAMQNVLLQIGLNLLSPSLQRIRKIRTYILRCHACFQNVKDMSKAFCPRCGKPTLTRVSCSTNQKGEFRIHLKKNMQWNHRGDRYSIPKPVGGSANGKAGQGKGGGKGGWGKELILAEDQKEYQRAVSGNKNVKTKDLMDEDYLPSILTGDRGRAGGRPKIGAGRNVNAKRRVK